MSAIGEWFGYYNAIFVYIERTYGQKELDKYLDYLAKTANADISALYREGGLKAVEERLVRNFRLDGGPEAVQSDFTGEQLKLIIHCPAYHNAPTALHPDRQVGGSFCQCCIRYNTGILREAGYDLDVCNSEKGECTWRIQKTSLEMSRMNSDTEHPSIEDFEKRQPN